MVDANQTRYHLLLGMNDWGSCTSQGSFLLGSWDPKTKNNSYFDWENERHELTLQALPFEFSEATANRCPIIDNRRGAARDRFGNWYWIDTNEQRIRVRSSGSNQVSDFWPVPTQPVYTPPGAFQDVEHRQIPTNVLMGGLTVTDDHYLVVGVRREGDNPAGLLIFDLHSIGEPIRVHWPRVVDFVPFDMSPIPGGGVWILDRKNRRYWKLDRQFNVVHSTGETPETLSDERADDFQPINVASPSDKPRGVPARTFPRGIRLEASSPLDATDPCSIEGLPDGTVLILDRRPTERFSIIYRYHFGSLTPQVIDLAGQITEGLTQQASATLTAHDFAFLPIHRISKDKVEVDRLFITSLTGDQTYIFHLWQDTVGDVHVNFLPEKYSPMRLYSGKALVASGEGVYYDIDELWVPLISQNRPRYNNDATLTTPLHLANASVGNTPLRPVFDGGDPDCVWHRLLLDACIPAGTSVEVSSRAANSMSTLADAEWQAEPPLQYWRHDGAELPFAPPLPENYRTWELLFQRAQGRYLQLKLRLRGDGRSTPRLRALRVYYPRFSYLNHYLPAVYREDKRSASLVDRFLANIEGTYTAIEDRIAAVQVLFDPLSVPSEALEWLGSWFGVALDPAWDESRRRLFIQYAMLFFQYRGTVRGLKTALHLALEPDIDEGIFAPDVEDYPCYNRIRIIERFRTRISADVEVGDPTTMSSDLLPKLQSDILSNAHRFSVLLPTPRLDNLSTVAIASQTQTLRELAARIIALEKPAHTVFDIRYYWAAFRVGEVRLGIDTLIDLGNRSAPFIAAMLLNEAYLGESYLASGHPQNAPDRVVVGRDRLDDNVGYSAYDAPHREKRHDE